MNINLKLKQRREKINEILRHKRTKVMRKFKQVKNEAKEEENNNSSDLIKNKIEKYLNVEKMIEKYDMKMGGKEIKEEKINLREITKPSDDTLQKRQLNDKNKSGNENQNNFNQKKGNTNNNKFLNNKRERKSPEEIENEKLEKLNKRKASYKKLNRKTPKGQPVMKYQVEHIFKKIKDKINKGLF